MKDKFRKSLYCIFFSFIAVSKIPEKAAFMKFPKIKLHWQILIALILAILYGLYLTEYVSYVAWMGDLFLRALKMIIIPLILSSLISGVSSASLNPLNNSSRVVGLAT